MYWLELITQTVEICLAYYQFLGVVLQWRPNGLDGVSDHQPYDCLLSRLFSHRSKKASKLRITGLCAGNSPVTGEFPHKGPVTRKMFPFDDVIMAWAHINQVMNLVSAPWLELSCKYSGDWWLPLSTILKSLYQQYYAFQHINGSHNRQIQQRL